MNENLKAFLLKVQGDEELQARVKEACEGLSGEEAATRLAELATREGLPLVADDFRVSPEDLDEAELIQVAGGRRYETGWCFLLGFSEWDNKDRWGFCVIGGAAKPASTFSCVIAGW